MLEGEGEVEADVLVVAREFLFCVCFSSSSFFAFFVQLVFFFRAAPSFSPLTLPRSLSKTKITSIHSRAQAQLGPSLPRLPPLKLEPGPLVEERQKRRRARDDPRRPPQLHVPGQEAAHRHDLRRRLVQRCVVFSLSLSLSLFFLGCRRRRWRRCFTRRRRRRRRFARFFLFSSSSRSEKKNEIKKQSLTARRRRSSASGRRSRPCAPGPRQRSSLRRGRSSLPTGERVSRRDFPTPPFFFSFFFSFRNQTTAMAPPNQQQEQQKAPPDAFIYRRGAAGGGLRAFPQQQQLWQQRRRPPQAAATAVAAASLTTASASASAFSNSTAFDGVPGFIACPEAFLEVKRR